MKTKTQRSGSFRKKGTTSSISNSPSKRRPSRPKAKKSGAVAIDPSNFVQKAKPSVQLAYESKRTFSELPLSGAIQRNLKSRGFERPTEIQDKAIEPILEGKDLLGIAQTGTGKTGAFLLPILENLSARLTPGYAIVLVPTRELAIQVQKECDDFSKGMGVYCSTFIGGTPINRDLEKVRRKNHIIIGTPGRLLDLMSRGALNLSRINTLVLDEYDRMLDMGFVHDVNTIVKAMPSRKQTMLFSATLDRKQESQIKDLLKNYTTVQISSGTSSSSNVDQDIVRIAEGQDKFRVLCDMMKEDEYTKVILFEETKHRVDRLSKKLNKAGIKSIVIHGNKSQNARVKALKDFEQGRVQILVATDVAARGIDIADVSHVINYSAPTSMDSYIHRIGRTGRAGKVGKALTFVA